MARLDWLWRRLGRDLPDSWRLAAASCGLQVTTLSLFPFYRMSAESKALRVLFTETSAEELATTQVVVTCAHPMRGSLNLLPESFWRKVFAANLDGRSELEIGDPAFDDAFLVSGSPSPVLAVLNADTRAKLATLHRQSRVQISAGTISASYRQRSLEVGLDRMLAQMIAVAQRLAADVDVPRELADNALQDPVAAVRLRNLLGLIRDFPEQEVVAETVAAALGDPVPEIRLRAALAAPQAGRPVLVALAEDAAIDDECAAAAIAALGRRLEASRAQSILTRALRSRRLETAAACIEALGGGGAEAVPTLRKVLAIERDRLAVAAARALGNVGVLDETGRPGVEAALRDALGRGLADVRIAAAEGLGLMGSADAVPALREAAAMHDDDRPLQRAIRQAIAEIHSRLPGASPGQLSLAAAGAGQLSLATAGGELSLAGSEAGQLALAPSRSGAPPLDEPPPGFPPKPAARAR